jgi:uncharacterized lipoprotein
LRVIVLSLIRLMIVAVLMLEALSGCSSGTLAPEAPEKPWKPAEKKKDAATTKDFDLPADSALPYKRDEVELVEEGPTICRV